MRINLKKARKLETKILSAINNDRILLDDRVRVNADITDIQVKILNGRKTAMSGIENKQKLIDLRFKIRRAIAVENENVGISALISDKTRLIAQKDLLNIYKHGTPSYDKDELTDVIEQARKDLNKDGSFMRNKSALIDVNVMGEEDFYNLENQYVQVLRDIEDIDDKIAEKNYTSKITLEKEDIDLLMLNKLI